MSESDHLDVPFGVRLAFRLFARMEYMDGTLIAVDPFWVAEGWAVCFELLRGTNTTVSATELRDVMREQVRRDRAVAEGPGAGDSGEELVVGEAALQGPESPAGGGE